MTVANLIDRQMLEMQVEGSEFSEPERQVMIEKISEFANQILLDINAHGHPVTIVCEQGQREYPLRELQRIDGLKKDGVDITQCRVTQRETYSRENRS